MLLASICFVLVVSVAASLLAFNGRRQGHIRAVGGVLDLQNWIPEADGYLDLAGEWSFYWGRLLSHSEVEAGSATPNMNAAVPDVWNSYHLDGKKLPGFGCATYVLHVTNAPAGTV